MFERWVLEDLEWNGVALRQGPNVGLLLGSANRDELMFQHPSRLDLALTPNDHASFGGGIHHCVGAPLVWLEMEVAFSHFVRRVEEFEIELESPPRIPSLVSRGFASCH